MFFFFSLINVFILKFVTLKAVGTTSSWATLIDIETLFEATEQLPSFGQLVECVLKSLLSRRDRNFYVLRFVI